MLIFDLISRNNLQKQTRTNWPLICSKNCQQQLFGKDCRLRKKCFALRKTQINMLLVCNIWRQDKNTIQLKMKTRGDYWNRSSQNVGKFLGKLCHPSPRKMFIFHRISTVFQETRSKHIILLSSFNIGRTRTTTFPSIYDNSWWISRKKKMVKIYLFCLSWCWMRQCCRTGVGTHAFYLKFFFFLRYLLWTLYRRMLIFVRLFRWKFLRKLILLFRVLLSVQTNHTTDLA